MNNIIYYSYTRASNNLTPLTYDAYVVNTQTIYILYCFIIQYIYYIYYIYIRVVRSKSDISHHA